MNRQSGQLELADMVVPVNNKMKILALDQSSKETGWSIFDSESKELLDFGLISINYSNLEKRLFYLREEVRKLIEKYNIEKVYLEDIQLQKITNGVTTYKVLAEVIGVLLELFYELNVSFELIFSTTWKSKLGIKGSDRKTQKANAKKYVEENYVLDKELAQDIADSICIGTYCINNFSN